jgi:hypothetical protein
MNATGGDLARLRADRVALALLAVGAIIRALFLAEILSAGVDVRGWVSNDSYLYDRSARRIAAGDVLARDRYEFSGTTPDEPGHPRKSFPIEVLGVERYDAEYGPSTYFDYPGYPYLVAASYAVFGAGSSAILALQEALDLLACALLYLIGCRLFDRTVARTGLALAVLTGPLVLYAGFVIRDSVIASSMVLIVYLALRAADPGRGPRAFFPLGLVLGLAWIVKGSVILLAPLVLARLFTGEARRAPRALALALGLVASVGPFAARNVALGVPPLRMTTIEVSALIIYNSPNAAVRGVWFDTARARAAADRCTSLTWGGALLTAARAHERPFGLVEQSARRAANLWVADDPWDNVRYSFLAPCLRSLRLAPVRWKLLEPFAVLGIGLALLDWRRLYPVLAPIALTLVMAALGVCLTRYRLVADHFHALLAASALVWLLREARAKRSRAIFVALAGVVVSVALHDSRPPPTPEEIARHVLGFGPETSRVLLGNLAR